MKAVKLQKTELDKIVYMMQFSQEICARTQIYRQYLGWNKKNGKKKITKILKQMKTTRFPAFAPCVVFNGSKSREDVIGLTDLCYLDIDHIKEAKHIREAMDKLSEDPYVVMASRSVSDNGLHILIRYKLKDMEKPLESVTMTPDEMQDVYNKVYSHLAETYFHKLRLESDLEAGHMEHLYIVSYDPELYYNPNAEPLMIDLNETKRMDAQLIIGRIKARIQEAVNLVSTNHLDDAEKIFQEAKRIIMRYFSSNDEVLKQDLSAENTKVDEYLENIKSTKETIAKVYDVMNEVDEDLTCKNTKAAWEKIVECQHLLKDITGLCKQKTILRKVRLRVHENEMKIGAMNRKIKYGYL